MPQLEALPFAPSFPSNVDWLPTAIPLALEAARGRILLVHFTDLGGAEAECDLAALRAYAAKRASRVACVAAHSAREERWGGIEGLLRAARRLGAQIPILNDVRREVARAYGVTSVPSTAIVDAEGRLVGVLEGGSGAEGFEGRLERIVGCIPVEPVGGRNRERAPRKELVHPTRVLAATESRIFVADTGRHRVVELDYDPLTRRARIARVFGAAVEGWHDAFGEEALFRSPRGMALDGRTLYVADTGNHCVRAIDLVLGDVRTIAGNGKRAEHRPRAGVDPRATALRAPWGVSLVAGSLWIAMAGSREVLALEEEHGLRRVAGCGRAGLVDGMATQACFGTPCDLVSAGRRVFVADAEAGAIRVIEGDGERVVRTLVGQGGRVRDEGGDRSGFQPSGLAFDGLLWVADAHDNRIKRVDPVTGEVRGLAGDGGAGWVDGECWRARFAGPEGVALSRGMVFVADTGNGVVRVVDVKRKWVGTVEVVG